MKELITPICKLCMQGLEAAWPPAVHAAFERAVGPRMQEDEIITQANYFTPRPYVDEYNSGSNRWGFIYTINHRHVCYINFETDPTKEIAEEATVKCSLCHKLILAANAHLHQGVWVGDECCWDDRLKASE